VILPCFPREAGQRTLRWATFFLSFVTRGRMQHAEHELLYQQPILTRLLLSHCYIPAHSHSYTIYTYSTSIRPYHVLGSFSRWHRNVSYSSAFRLPNGSESSQCGHAISTSAKPASGSNHSELWPHAMDDNTSDPRYRKDNRPAKPVESTGLVEKEFYLLRLCTVSIKILRWEDRVFGGLLVSKAAPDSEDLSAHIGQGVAAYR
jgi:hypothetical protein